MKMKNLQDQLECGQESLTALKESAAIAAAEAEATANK